MQFGKKYRFRLVIGLPLVVICFTVAAGSFPNGMIDYNLTRVERPFDLKPLLLSLKITVLALTTADLFLQMTEGMVSLNADGKVAFLNAHMERLLGIQRLRYIGKHYADIFPNPARNIEIHGLIEDVLHSATPQTRDILVWTPGGRDVFVRTTVSPATGKHKES